jgi:hypothetical protein
MDAMAKPIQEKKRWGRKEEVRKRIMGKSGDLYFFQPPQGRPMLEA